MREGKAVPKFGLRRPPVHPEDRGRSSLLRLQKCAT